MAYVTRDSGGNIIGVFNWPQGDAVDGSGNVISGVTTEQLSDDHTDIVSFKAAQMEVFSKRAVTVETLQAAIAAMPGGEVALQNVSRKA